MIGQGRPAQVCVLLAILFVEPNWQISAVEPGPSGTDLYAFWLSAFWRASLLEEP